MKQYKKWAIAAAVLAMALLCALIGSLLWQHTAFQQTMFGYRYSVTSVFFAVGQPPVYAPEKAVYGLSDTGKLLDISGESPKRVTGSLRKLTLTEENFDQAFAEEGIWRVVGIDAESARKFNVQAWQYRCLDGSFYYILLQENQDVFLCIGKNGAIERFMWLQPLDEMGGNNG